MLFKRNVAPGVDLLLRKISRDVLIKRSRPMHEIPPRFITAAQVLLVAICFGPLERNKLNGSIVGASL